MLLDTELLTRRRQTLRISVRGLADTLGVAMTVIVRLEEGTNHHDLPLHLVVRLAEALAIDVSHLIVRPNPDQPADEWDKPPEPDDAATVGAVLAEADVLTPIDTIASALDWTLDRTEAALEELAGRAPAVGLQVHRLRGTVRLVADDAPCDPEHVEQLIRIHDARTGMHISQAQTLKKVIDGADHRQLSSNADTVNVGRLRNAGYLTRDETPELTDAVLYSLDPTAATITDDVPAATS